MTKLLVSVRDAAEARAALDAGADLIDVKEPRRGPLGSADPTTIAAVLDAVAGRVPVSAALGELLDWHDTAAHDTLSGLAFAKFGLSSCAKQSSWEAAWRRAIGRLPRGVRGVAVVYADWQRAAAPTPQAVLANAEAVGCSAVLVDTFDKAGGSLLRHWSLAEVERFVSAAHTRGLLAVVAGGLDSMSVGQVATVQCDYVGVAARCAAPTAPARWIRTRRASDGPVA